MEYQPSIQVLGAGEDPNHRSHWRFAINQPPSLVGDLLHVRPIDLDRLWYEFEPRFGTELPIMQALGMCRLATLSPQQRRLAIEVLTNGPAPRNGRRKCPDWVFSTVIALEVEELVPSETAEWWKGMVGLPAREVAKAAGEQWTWLTD